MKKILILVIALGCSFFNLEGQSFGLIQKTTLVQRLSETSGLIVVGGKFFTHGDSGDEPKLYELDTATGNIIRTVFIPGSMNKDWEEITHDDSWVYVGDFGNNAGMRQDLVIYKIRKNLLSLDTINEVDTIQFGYEQQVDFSNRTFQTNFDAEAMIATDTFLYIFSKNWGNFKSYLYKCPKAKGKYQLKVIDSFDANGLITGACLSQITGKLMLCGYTFNSGFVLECDSFLHSHVKKKFNRQEFPTLGNIQIEAIAEVSKDRYFLTSEQLNSDAALLELVKIKTSGLDGIIQKRTSVNIHQSSNSKVFHWNANIGIRNLEIYNMSQQLLFLKEINNTNQGEIDLSLLESGLYVLKGISGCGEIFKIKFIVKDE